MIDYNISGMSWIKIKKNNYKYYPKNKLSNCQIEIWTDINNLIIIPLKEKNKIAPLRILSIDIECSSENSKFPIPQKDPIIVISNILFEFNDKEKKIINQSIFSFYKCANISNVDIYSFDNEVDLLNQWRNYIIKLDPDIITGFNINSFDFPYLIKRSEYLKIKNFSLFSRIKNSYSYLINSTKTYFGFIKKEISECKITGRIILDMYSYIRIRYNLSSYTLNNESKEFLNEQKKMFIIL